ncbi:chorismate mutase [Pseudoclavibacter sp. RFBJ3]|uniref:chorismate mutase n=1 Tax=unclassified Pseudoclavibacter TaxID=2615177 RepID=UPI000CE7F278|nr:MULTISPECIES: chorismate mutase [unclassified Pseudoclavibacter]PPF86519.1 chorismate mutase [Pseudoclavibacter sp. RFBJ5]PPF95252.1 chorismate mutase [Pseudoclavibacter sp. RFBJ3]PPF97686.1 chorismate mutase [Pseudoclavibacter sp. RFBH5]PPG22661.1 chorismate mutase [Pseudoclavibacter sp. RFBI4]
MSSSSEAPAVRNEHVDGVESPASAPDAQVQHTSDDAALRRLTSIRGSIDNIDAALVHMLAERFKFTTLVGELKAEHGLPPADPDRERRQILRLRQLAEEAHLDPEFAETFINFVIAEVIRHHERIAEQN